MERVDETLPKGSTPVYEADHRGQEVVHVTENQSVRTWTCPYTGPRRFHAPKFRATAARAEELAAEVASRTSTMGGRLYVARCSENAEDGTAEWAIAAFTLESAHALGE